MKGNKGDMTLGVTHDPVLRGRNCGRDLTERSAELAYELCNPYMMISRLSS